MPAAGGGTSLFWRVFDGEESETGAQPLKTGYIWLKRTIMCYNLNSLIWGIVIAAVGGVSKTNEFIEFAGDTLSSGLITMGVFLMCVSNVGQLVVQSVLWQFWG